MNFVSLLAKTNTCDINIDPIVPGTIRTVVTILKIAIPIILIIFGMLDLAKAVMANDDKEMKEAQKKLIHRIIYAVVIFFVVALVQFVFRKLAEAGKSSTEEKVNGNNISACISCFISDGNACSSTNNNSGSED